MSGFPSAQLSPLSCSNVPFCVLQVSPNDDGLVHKATLPLLSHLRQAIPFNPLSANLTRWSNTLTGCQPTNCLSVFDHFVGLALKGLTNFCIRFCIYKAFIWPFLIHRVAATKPL